MACRAGLLDELSFIGVEAVFAKDTVVMFDVVYYTQLAVRMFHYRALQRQIEIFCKDPDSKLLRYGMVSRQQRL